jgi:hypothetical protein
MAKAPTLSAPLPFSKTELSAPPALKASMTIVGTAIVRGVRGLKTPASITAFWRNLGIYCARNLTQIEGLAAGTPAVAAKTATTKTAGVRRAHRKTAGAIA